MALDWIEKMKNMDWWGDRTFTFEMNIILVAVIGGIILLVLYIWMATYVHKDAVKRDIPNPGVWIFIVLIFHVGGLFIYLIVRGSYSTNKQGCQDTTPKVVHTYQSVDTPKVVQTYQSVNPYKQAGTIPKVKVSSVAKFCPMCGLKLRENAGFCAMCGTKI